MRPTRNQGASECYESGYNKTGHCRTLGPASICSWYGGASDFIRVSRYATRLAIRITGGRLAGGGRACYPSDMPRWLHFILGFITLIALAVAVMRAVVRHMPGGVSAWFARWSYEALVLMLAAAFVPLVGLLTRKGKVARTDEEP